MRESTRYRYDGTGFHALKYPICRIHKGETKRLRRREPKIT
jgi:hypothetical protein